MFPGSPGRTDHHEGQPPSLMQQMFGRPPGSGRRPLHGFAIREALECALAVLDRGPAWDVQAVFILGSADRGDTGHGVMLSYTDAETGCVLHTKVWSREQFDRWLAAVPQKLAELRKPLAPAVQKLLDDIRKGEGPQDG